MASRLRPQKFQLLGTCTSMCTLNPGRLPGQLGEVVHGWFEDGSNNPQIHEKAKALGLSISDGAAGRHRKNHLAPVDERFPDPTLIDLDPSVRLGELEILEIFIQQGARGLQQRTTKVTPEQTLKAMELKFKLTQGSAFQSFVDAFADLAEEEPSLDGDEVAVSSEEEQAQAAESE